MAIGVITGSGTYALSDVEGAPREVDTPFGAVALTVGALADVSVVHLSRHGDRHARLSSHVTHQANICALKSVGVDAVLASTVCGAVDPDLALGSLVVFDDMHFLSNRLPDGSLCTLHTQEGAPGRGHWVYDCPFSAALRAALIEGARRAGQRVHDGGCYGHVDGPRFNTKAEIRGLRACGVTAVSQTAGPEATLAGEAELPYALVGYITDYANGVKPEPTPVEQLQHLIAASRASFAALMAATLPLAARAQARAVGHHFRFD